MSYRKIGLIGAMDEEIKRFLDHIDDVKTIEKAGIRFYEGFFYDTEVVLCKSGVGKVNAAVCSQILIDHFEINAVIFTGVAGALHPDLQIGDIVISTDCMHHDMDASPLGFSRGTIPYDKTSIFKADDDLIKAAFQASEKSFHNRTRKGRILSGDQFIADREVVQQLHKQMDGDCTEMEGAAVAQVCSMNEVPFVIIRSMSDKADGSADVNFAEFVVQASQHSYQIVEQMLKNINPHQM
ncbi:5'-methylthioadenosine/adenosylhomocysteine nucleosidase [Chengkuizengella axinellae]|uniref:adenosylhomocysteine nucleosidase n=1 Tax=Chengkuizengella axinellae TaxID=3064388 RepID=A0ABT9IVE3_9BACL|nr:5'-methylthioadenosine/adenosylhomocysteine nucleosidase [Chengkuizengella sp. 2205SS18-9]MDP5273320.1 5'-methylthioadenosine/adenosylhomocysteine nucleosidase [Chengkuizengella sp. 2205SS18-9]